MNSSVWHSFKDRYFSKHEEFLSHVWFELQGYTQKNIRERVGIIKKADYIDLESSLKVYDIEGKTKEIIHHCKTVLYIPQQCNIYLFIGFFSPDAFVFRFNDTYVMAVGLERFHTFSYYSLLIAHEYCHLVQNVLNGESNGSNDERIIREGISILFSQIAYPGKPEWAYLLLNRSNYNYFHSHYHELLLKWKENRWKNKDIFHGITDENVPRLGYFIGYNVVKSYMKRHGVHTVQELIEQSKLILLDKAV